MEHNANTDAVDSARKEIVWNLQNIATSHRGAACGASGGLSGYAGD